MAVVLGHTASTCRHGVGVYSLSLLLLICGHVACQICLRIRIYNILRHIMSRLLPVVWFVT